jgi:hypothetical protein
LLLYHERHLAGVNAPPQFLVISANRSTARCVYQGKNVAYGS